MPTIDEQQQQIIEFKNKELELEREKIQLQREQLQAGKDYAIKSLEVQEKVLGNTQKNIIQHNDMISKRILYALFFLFGFMERRNQANFGNC